MIRFAFTVNVKANDTIDNVKLKIHEHTGLLPEHQVLSDQPIEGKCLEDGKTLSDYSIYNEGTVFLSSFVSFERSADDPFNIFGQSSASSSSGNTGVKV